MVALMQGRAKAPGFGRARSWLMFGVVAVTAGATLSCTVAAVAGGVAAVAVGAAIITSGCYDPVKVELLDGSTGLPLCDAKLVAVEEEEDGDGGTTEFSSCFYADVPVGKWRLEATRPGYLMTRSPLVVSKPAGCQPVPQRVTLFIWPEPSSVRGGVPAASAATLPETAPPAAPPPVYPGSAASGAAPADSSSSVDTGAPPAPATPTTPTAAGGSAGSNAAPVAPGAGAGGGGAR